MSEHELWNELGNLYFMSGAYDQAAYAYHRSIHLDGAFGRPYSNLALTYVQQGRYEEAVELYRRSLELLAENQEKAISWSRLGNVYRAMRNYPEAVVAYQHADELDPENSGNREGSNQILYGSAGFTISREDLLKELGLSSADDMSSLPASDPGARGTEDASATSTREASRQASEGDSLMGRADPRPEEDPDLAGFFAEDAQVYFPDVDQDALTDWLPIPKPVDSPAQEQAVMAAPDSEDEARNRDDGGRGNDLAHYPGPQSWTPVLPLLAPNASPFRDEEYSEQAVKLAEVAVDESSAGNFIVAEEQPEDPAPAILERQQDEPDHESVEDNGLNIELEIPKLRRLVQINPNNAVTWNTLGNLYKTSGQYKDAILAYQQATSVDPEKAEYYHNLGLVYGAEGRDEDAIIALQKVLELKPDHSLTHATLGGYYRKMGLDELAQKHIGKAMKHIYDSESEYNRACLEAICGNTDQAIDLLRVALENKQTYVDWVLRDPDLDTIREDRRFKQLISDFT